MKNLKTINLFGIVFKITLFFFEPFFFSASFCSDSLLKITDYHRIKNSEVFNYVEIDDERFDYLEKKIKQLQNYLLDQKNSNADYLKAINETIDDLCKTFQISPFSIELKSDLFLNKEVRKADKKEISNAIDELRIYFYSNYFSFTERKNYTEYYRAMENYNNFIKMFLAGKIYLSGDDHSGRTYEQLIKIEILAKATVSAMIKKKLSFYLYKDTNTALRILQNNQEHVEQNLENKKKSQNLKTAAIKFFLGRFMHQLLVEGFIEKEEEIGKDNLKEFFVMEALDKKTLNQRERYLRDILQDILQDLIAINIKRKHHPIEVKIRDQLKVLSKFIKYQKIFPKL